MSFDFSKSDFRDILRDNFEDRCQRNSRYSLRAFARDLGMSASRLSEVLSGRYGISRGAANEISEKLGLTKSEGEYFCDLVESQHGRTPVRRESARLRLKKYSETSPSKSIGLDSFRIIADWYHFAILELTKVEGFKSNSEWIAEHLGIKSEVADQAIKRLLRIGLLEKKDGKYMAVDDFSAVGEEIPSDAIKSFHFQLLTKAQKALYEQALSARDFNSVVLAVDQNKLPAAKLAIKKFKREFMEHFGDQKTKNKVYGLLVHFFDINTR